MKKILYSVISLALLCGLYSCSDNDPKFYTLGGGYCVQLGDAEFRPAVYFAAYYDNFDQSATTVTKDGGNIQVRSYFDNLIETVGTTPLLSEVEGTYH
ncbi:MAG: hypothetical protein LUE10_02145, partial [Alistipes sp.]|nr:hypothetical protein [Alistipes sp.]